ISHCSIEKVTLSPASMFIFFAQVLEVLSLLLWNKRTLRTGVSVLRFTLHTALGRCVCVYLCVCVCMCVCVCVCLGEKGLVGVVSGVCVCVCLGVCACVCLGERGLDVGFSGVCGFVRA